MCSVLEMAGAFEDGKCFDCRNYDRIYGCLVQLKGEPRVISA